jgi:hypothetical protein
LRPSSPHAVSVEDRISGEQGEISPQGLSGKETIEWIPMMERQRSEQVEILRFWREHLNCISFKEVLQRETRRVGQAASQGRS